MKTKSRLTSMGIVALVIGAGGSATTAPTLANQQATARPGDPTRAHVWIDNMPLPVDVRTMPPLTLNASSEVQARLVRQVWEYRTIVIGRGADVAAALAQAGNTWEVTGVQFATPDGTLLLLKRPL